MSAGIRDLKVWQEGVTLAADVIRALRAANRREIKGVVEAAMACATTVVLRVADGYARYEPAEQRRQYTEARRELARLETHLGVLRQTDILPAPAYQQISGRMQQVHRLLGGYLIYLDRQIASGARRDGMTAAERPALTPASTS
jgi:four helix bundle protein